MTKATPQFHKVSDEEEEEEDEAVTADVRAEFEVAREAVASIRRPFRSDRKSRMYDVVSRSWESGEKIRVFLSCYAAFANLTDFFPTCFTLFLPASLAFYLSMFPSIPSQFTFVHHMNIIPKCLVSVEISMHDTLCSWVFFLARLDNIYYHNRFSMINFKLSFCLKVQ